jgi:hypothetical protein
MPKVNRAWPVNTSIPTTPTRSPPAAEINDRAKDSWARKQSKRMAAHMSAKYSTGPKAIARRESGKAVRVTMRVVIDPPMKEPNAEIHKATPARPCLAI